MKKKWLAVPVTLFALAGLAGCGGDKTSTPVQTPAPASTPGKQEQPAAAPETKKPSFKVEGIKDGDTLKPGDVKIKVALTDFKLVDFSTNKEPKAGEGHIHIWLDTDPKDAKIAQKVIKDADNIVLKDVKAGEHTLVVSLNGNDHKPVEGTAPVTIKFTVK
ncbi:hypothetical protein [Effusibacillus lacus]|uniref:DUF4399 domain-containing protein n=1 Tax=Effusibacillus lacus TaxID=1348429 RepID=A0A292YSH0_9BACL|nr:hypothetical protein [Effusibacillus lacus]TCS76062.1 hypothetical protein EDD64_10434 [Effusibacillus lacus]GAX91420.1 hypothetical protein EFBL_3089 [Effusibacillus lacus]